MHTVPVVLLLAGPANLLNLPATTHTLDEPDEATFGHQYVSAASGWCVRQRGRSAFIGLLVPHLWRASGQASIMQRTASEHAAGGTLMLLADVLARAGLPGDLPAGTVLALIGSPCFVWLVSEDENCAGYFHHPCY